MANDGLIDPPDQGGWLELLYKNTNRALAQQPWLGLPVLAGRKMGEQLAEGAKLTGEAYKGKIDLQEPRQTVRAAQAGLTAMSGGMPAAEVGALGAMGGRLGGKTAADMVSHGPLLADHPAAIAPARSELAAPTVIRPGPDSFPGIYGDPRQIAEAAAANTAPESPNMKALFGVTRQDLANTADRRLAPEQMYWNPRPKVKGSETSSRVMIPENAQRLQDTLGELQKRAPGMYTGMKGWYVMDPAYQRLVELVGPEQAQQEYRRLNAMSFFSPSSDVLKEINRGTAGGMFWKQGIPGFRDAGLSQAKMEQMGYPLVQGHPYHRTAMHDQQLAYLNSDQAPGMTDPKVPLYLQASLPPEMGGQSILPVPDAHFSRGLGMADVRPWLTDPKTGRVSPNARHMKAAEYSPIGPWFRQNVAEPMGLQAVPAQAIQWGGLGHLTGVKTKVGAPKLELFSDRIAEIAKQLGITEQKDLLKFRDQVLLGEKHAALIPSTRYG